jgi:hypothetical protein
MRSAWLGDATQIKDSRKKKRRLTVMDTHFSDTAGSIP